MARGRIHDLDLPMYVRLRRGVYYYVWPKTGQWQSLGRNRANALLEYSKLLGIDAGAHWDRARIFGSMKRNAKLRGIPMEITYQHLDELIKRAGHRCEVTGIPFEYEKGQWRRAPWAPSIDRIDSSKGYTLDNVRLVCVAANLAMNEWGEEVLERLSTYYRRKKRETLPLRETEAIQELF